MNKLVSLLLLSCILIATSYAQVMQYDGDWVETRCELCSKRTYYWSERSYGVYGMAYSPTPLCPGESRQILEYKRTLDVCPLCYEKNRVWFQQAIGDQAEKSIQALKDTYREERKKNEELIKQEDLRSIDKQIDELQERKRDIKEGKNEETNNSFTSSTFIIDSGSDFILSPDRK